MNPVGELLAVDDVRLDLDVSARAQLLEQVAALLARRPAIAGMCSNATSDRIHGLKSLFLSRAR